MLARAGRLWFSAPTVLPLLHSSLLVVSALFPIVNPLGGAPIFLSLTYRYSEAERRILSRSIAVNSVLLLIGAYFVGNHILAFFGISLPVVQVGGGLVVMASGWSMLKQKDNDETRGEVHEALDRRTLSGRAFYPFTLPLTVGPGSISVAITLGANAPSAANDAPSPMFGAILGCLLIGTSVYFCYAFAQRLAKILGPSAMAVILRLSSFLLVCIGVQILWNGVSALVSSLPVLNQCR